GTASKQLARARGWLTTDDRRLLPGFLELRQRRAIAIDAHAADGTVGWNPLLHELVGDRDDDVGGPAVRIRQRHGHRQVEDEVAEHASIAPHLSKPVAERDRSLIAHVERPAAELTQHLLKRLVAAPLLRVERREVLSEPFAQPLLVIVLPADRLAPPLVRHLV